MSSKTTEVSDDAAGDDVPGAAQPAGLAPAPAMDADQQETWFAWMRVMLRLSYEMNRQLQADTDLSLNDFHVLNALADSPGERLQLTALASRISWERSRLSHHLGRMDVRGLVRREPSQADGRATDAVLTDAGRAAVLDATPGHAAWVRELVFGGLDPALQPPLRAALEQIHDHVVALGSLPTPGPPQHRFTGLDGQG